jgi:hypothetical protein
MLPPGPRPALFRRLLLALAIVGKTLFDTDDEPQAGEIGQALTGVLESFWLLRGNRYGRDTE